MVVRDPLDDTFSMKRVMVKVTVDVLVDPKRLLLQRGVIHLYSEYCLVLWVTYGVWPQWSACVFGSAIHVADRVEER